MKSPIGMRRAPEAGNEKAAWDNAGRVRWTSGNEWDSMAKLAYNAGGRNRGGGPRYRWIRRPDHSYQSDWDEWFSIIIRLVGRMS
jgi:hypothetical protein